MGRRVLLLMTWAACGDGDGGDAPPAEPVAAEDFCEAWVTAVCAKRVECDCGGPSDCADDVAVDCPLAMGNPTLNLLEMEKVTYGAQGAGDLIAWIVALECAATLEEAAHPTDFARRFGAIDGTVEPGGECSYRSNGLSDECKGSACSDAEDGVCIARALEGEPCDASTLCEGDDLLCIEDECAPARAAGDSCEIPQECASGDCFEGECNPLLTLGTNCDLDEQCDSGRCDAATGRCAAQIEDGELCRKDTDCLSGMCSRRDDPNHAAAGLCVLPAEVGEECEVNDDCASLVCAEGQCTTLACGLAKALG